MKRQYSILCVDDDETTLRSIQRALLTEDYDCYFAKTAEDGLALLGNKDVDVIVTEMKLAGMDGLEFLRIVKEKWPLTVRVVISGYIHLPQIIAAINGTEIFRFITKPLTDKRYFIEVIKASIEKFKVLDEADRISITLKSRNNTYKNMIKKSNEMVDSAKHAEYVVGTAVNNILKSLYEQINDKVDISVAREVVGKTQEVVQNLLRISALDFVVFEIEELMDRISGSMSSFEGIKRVDIERKDGLNLKVRVRDGLVEYAVANLIDSMLPDIKKYVKLFMVEPTSKFESNIMIVVSPIHRDESQSDIVKTHMHFIWTQVLKVAVESFEGSFEFVNKGTKYLLKLEFPRYTS